MHIVTGRRPQTETAARTVPLTVRELAAAETDPLLWPQLQPQGPDGLVIAVDLDTCDRADQHDAAVAADRVAMSDRIVVGLASRPLRDPRLTPLLDALTFTLTPPDPDPFVPAGPNSRGAESRPPTDFRRDVPVADPDAELCAIADSVALHPLAAQVLRQVLAATCRLEVFEGLRVESLAYSTLMAGPEFARWLTTRRPRRPAEADLSPIRLHRLDDRLEVTLDDPDRRNAYSAGMREALRDGLSIALLDPGIRRVDLRGAGPAFCSGGDLAEFGTGPGGSIAHVVRTQHGPGILLHRLRDRVVAHLHGACIGAGIELPAFAGRVIATPDTVIALPEIAMGLIPGAGGTVSITRRVGRWRTAYLALRGRPIDALTALGWGLVDEIRY
jgi:Enoyl-CoA hydratase/isomerase